MSDEEFWRMTPRQYWALLDRRLREERRFEVQMGIVASVVANALGRKKGDPAFTADQFTLTGTRRNEPQTVEEQIAAMRNLSVKKGRHG